MKKFLSIVLLMITVTAGYGQQEIQAKEKIVFILVENQTRNVVMIPNFGKLFKFKIYRRLKSTDEFELVAEKTKPALPMRYNATPHGVTWEDPDYHSRDIEYKVLAFDKKGNELCEMQIIWEEKK